MGSGKGWMQRFPKTSLVGFSVLLVISATQGARADFTVAERSAVTAYWADPSRFTIEPAIDAAKGQLWVVRQTVDGSAWLYNLNRSRNIPKGAVSTASNPWDAWIDGRMALEKWQTEAQAAAANAKVFNLLEPIPSASPADPGPIPDDLLSFAGNPPRFFAAVIPQRYCVRFDSTMICASQDQVAIRARSPYFRFSQGVRSVGIPLKSLPANTLDEVVTQAGITPSQARVFRAVSLLEGGFDAVNTYDTGIVSVGFIQFTAGQLGNGSLCAVLVRNKADQPQAFEDDFRKFGIDVSADGVLQVVDPITGAVLDGALAAQKIVDEKRLTAVFQRAGLVSRAFQVAQLEVARDRYLPISDAVTVMINGETISGTVADVIRSEAGLATLMDRKVNAGNIEMLNSVLQSIVDRGNVATLSDLAPFEREIVERLKYRKDYLLDTTLTQPSGEGTRLKSGSSRSGKRIATSGKKSGG
jgi:hypothetical protein